EVTDPESAQFRLFDAYTSFIRAIAAEQPLLLVLDDLHWADKPSLMLLQHFARSLSRMRVLVVGTYRDTDLVRTHPLSEALVALNREGAFDRVLLRGLSESEVGAYIRATANVEAPRELVERIHRETEGNPFFLSEVVALMTQEGAFAAGAQVALPQGVREALGRRLDRLSPEANELLQVAAVTGREFRFETLLALGDHEEEALLELVEEALAARVVEETGSAGQYRFTHALMQETLLDELSTTRRVRLHGRIGEALEQRWGPERSDERATRLAQHFVEAATLTDRHAEKALHYSLLAAEQAEAQAGWGEAARRYEHCLALLADTDTELEADEAELLVAAGRCYRNTNAHRDAWRRLLRAIDLYRNRQDAIGMAGATLEALQVEAPPIRLTALAEEALDDLGDTNPEVEARLLGRLLTVGDRGSPADEERRRERATELAERHNLADVRAMLELRAASDAFAAGRYNEAAAAQLEAQRQFEALGLARDAAGAYTGRVANLTLAGQLAVLPTEVVAGEWLHLLLCV
ncbi:MAG: AAA family ATPase, partial [Chloroflexi bacterium]|nr:AAA family ATPase [Chloroflexota bacterium]